jgi:hypothetical protein
MCLWYYTSQDLAQLTKFNVMLWVAFHCGVDKATVGNQELKVSKPGKEFSTVITH